MATPAERRAAQRRNAKAIKSGTYQKSPIGAKARAAAEKYKTERQEYVDHIRAYKDTMYAMREKFSQVRSDRAVSINPVTGKRRPIEQLRALSNAVQRYYDNGDDMMDLREFDDDILSSGFYH